MLGIVDKTMGPIHNIKSCAWQKRYSVNTVHAVCGIRAHQTTRSVFIQLAAYASDFSIHHPYRTLSIQPLLFLTGLLVSFNFLLSPSSFSYASQSTMMLLSLLLLGVLFIAGLLYLLFYPPSDELPQPRPWQPVQDNSANNSPPKGERMDDGEKAELERVFAAFDKDGDGVLSEQELRESLNNIGIFMTDKHVKEVMEKLDANGDGLVDIKEFCEMFKASQEGVSGKHGVEPRVEDEREVELKEAFDVFDKNGDGLISVEELGKILLGFGLKEGEKMEDCREMIRRVDMDGDGMVNLDEFRRMMQSGGKLFTGF